MKNALLLLVAVAFLALGCQTTETPGDEVGATTDPIETSIPGDTIPPQMIVDDVGTVEYQDIEGGFYGIVAEDGSQYNPQELEEEYQEDGLRVRFRGYVDEEAMTAQMWGKSFVIMEIMALN